MSKKSLGQFFTTNVEDILDGMVDYVGGKDVVDPFAGKCDLLTWAKKKGAVSYIGYDIDPQLINNVSVFYNDSLFEIKKSEFIITNPPYLARNKMSKEQKDSIPKEYSDLYLLSLKRIIDSDSDEGIIIIPVNFFSAENSKKVRRDFLSKYKIDKINYFTARVFEDTSCNVAAFHFVKDNANAQRELAFRFLPENKVQTFNVEQRYDYSIGGDEVADIESIDNVLNVRRLTEDMIEAEPGSYKLNAFLNDFKTEVKYKVSKQLRDMIANNTIVIDCVDDTGDGDKIRAESIAKYGKDCLVGKSTSRKIMYVLLDGVPIKNQETLIARFNEHLSNMREKYRSLFLTNFRDGDRKRVGFDFCYKLLNYCHHALLTEQIVRVA